MSIPNPPSTDSSKTTGKPFLTRTAIRGPRTNPKSSPVPTSILSPIERLAGRTQKGMSWLMYEIPYPAKEKSQPFLANGLPFSSFLFPQKLCQSRRSHDDKVRVCLGPSHKFVNSTSALPVE